MRPAWRSPARWLDWRPAWRADNGARRRAAILSAFVDRTRIDWTAALKRARDPGLRAFLEALQRLDAMRAPAPRSAGRQAAGLWTWPLAAAAALGTAKVIVVLALAALGPGAWPVCPGTHLALAAAFAAASLLLAAPALRDDRAFILLTILVLAAGAFAHPSPSTLPGDGRAGAAPLFAGVDPDVFIAAALWELAVVFPSVHRFTTIDVWARRAAVGAWIVSSALFAVNLLPAADPAVGALGRNHPGNLDWRIFAATALPAAAVIVLRALRAPRLERLRVIRFAWAFAAGAGPFLLIGAARTVPSVDAWARSAAIRGWMDAVVLAGLGALPVLTSIAVLVDDPFEPPAAIDGATGRVDRRLVRIWSGLARPIRRRRVRERLAPAVERLRFARGARELLALLRRELIDVVRAGSVAIVEPAALPADTALMCLLGDAAGPVDLSRDREPFLLLPRHDRVWLESNATALLTAVRLRDGSVPALVLIGERATKEGFDRADRWFIRTLVAAAAAAWPADDAADGGDHADECLRCGQLRDPREPPCCPGAAAGLALLPRRLAGKYTVTRRLGSGGMGIVYLARDEALGREVALKTLPGVREGAIPRLRHEARTMAALNHPAIATIYGIEIWRRTPVLVVEYCARGTLADALAARGRLPAGDALRLGERLAGALAYMHARGVLHRDLKPGNIGFPSDGEAKLLDFGLSGVEDRTAGTAAYLPPEVLAGARPGPAVDLWALAVVLREASVPDDRVAAFLTRALAPRPANRYRSAAEMQAALGALLGRRSARGRPRS